MLNKIFLSLFIVTVFTVPTLMAQDGAKTTGFCFEFSTNLEQVKKHLSAFLLPHDRIREQEGAHCLIIELTESRRNLFQRMIEEKFKILRVFDETGEHSGPQAFKQCHLEVQSVTLGKGQDSTYGIENRGARLQQGTSNSQTISTSSLILMQGKPGSIQTDKDSLWVICREKGKGQYQLEFSLFSGKPNEGSHSVSSTIMAAPGDRIDLGGIRKELDEKNRQLDVKGDAVWKKNQGSETTQFWLIIK